MQSSVLLMSGLIICLLAGGGAMAQGQRPDNASRAPEQQKREQLLNQESLREQQRLRDQRQAQPPSGAAPAAGAPQTSRQGSQQRDRVHQPAMPKGANR